MVARKYTTAQIAASKVIATPWYKERASGFVGMTDDEFDAMLTSVYWPYLCDYPA
jgi:hypothetical protein